MCHVTVARCKEGRWLFFQPCDGLPVYGIQTFYVSGLMASLRAPLLQSSTKTRSTVHFLAARSVGSTRSNHIFPNDGAQRYYGSNAHVKIALYMKFKPHSDDKEATVNETTFPRFFHRHAASVSLGESTLSLVLSRSRSLSLASLSLSLLSPSRLLSRFARSAKN